MGCPTQCLAEFCLISILTELGLTRRCRIDRLKAQSLPKGSRRLAGAIPSFLRLKQFPR